MKEYPITVLYRRRLFILLAGLLFLPIAMRAQAAGDKRSDSADGDSVAIRTVLYFSRNNADWIERSEYLKVGRFLRWALQDTLSQISLSGWADRTGTDVFNEQFSLRRARAVRNYLVRKGVSADRIRIEGKGVDIHEPDDALCRRVEMLGIRLPDFTTTAEDTLPQEQIAMPVTETQGVAKDTLQSKDTLSVAKVPLQVSDDTMPITAEVSQQAVEHVDTTVRQTEQAEQTSVIIRQPTTISPELSAASATFHGRYVAVKTNLAAWAGTIINAAAEVQVGKHWSVELPVLWCPWHVSDRHAVKTFTIQPEGRYWLAKPGEGHFFGVHAHVGWLNIKWKRDRYQGADRPLLGAGISYGYLLPFSEHWAGEFTIGAGYANMRYDTFYNIDNGARIDTRTKNYWGITRIGISVVYRFNIKK